MGLKDIILLLVAALILRLYPTLVSGLPFSTDAWPLIRNTELLLEYTPINIGDEKVFDGYNNYWPGSSFFGAVISEIAGVKPAAALASGIPLAASTTILIFYVLAKRVGNDGKRMIALTSSILLATAFPYALITAGVTKEAYANPIYMTSILILIGLKGWRGALLFSLSSVALAMSHHIASLVTIMALASITLSSLFEGFVKGIDMDKYRPLLTLIMSLSIALFFALYAHRGLKIALTVSDFITAASYQLLAFAFAVYLAYLYKRATGLWIWIRCSLATFIMASILVLCTVKRVMPEAPILPSRYIIYGVPFIISTPLAILGFEETKATKSEDENNFAPLFWIASILGLEAYAVFGSSPVGLTLAYRVINFLWPPLAIFCGYGLNGLLSGSISVNEKHDKKVISGTLVATALILVAAFSCYDVYAAVSMQERYMGYFWLYRTREYEAASWIKIFGDNITISGDIKTMYLLKGYFNMPVDVVQGLKYLVGEGRKLAVLVIYDQMLQNGYVIHGGLSLNLPKNWVEKMGELQEIYANGFVNVYSGINL
ncbi:MAG: hypothetical protein QW782_05430 [Candidatus Bathyarchaeia archaeon]